MFAVSRYILSINHMHGFASHFAGVIYHALSSTVRCVIWYLVSELSYSCLTTTHPIPRPWHDYRIALPWPTVLFASNASDNVHVSRLPAPQIRFSTLCACAHYSWFYCIVLLYCVGLEQDSLTRGTWRGTVCTDCIASIGADPVKNKTAEQSQRRPHDAPNIWVPWKVLRVLTTHPATFPEICNGLLFRSIDY